MSIAPRENIPLPFFGCAFSSVFLAMLDRDGSSTYAEFQSILTHLGPLWGPWEPLTAYPMAPLPTRRPFVSPVIEIIPHEHSTSRETPK